MDNTRITKLIDENGKEIQAVTVSPYVIENFEKLMKDTKWGSSTHFAILDREILDASLKNCYYVVLRLKETYEDEGYTAKDILCRALVSFDTSLDGEQEKIKSVIETKKNNNKECFLTVYKDNTVPKYFPYDTLEVAKRAFWHLSPDMDTFPQVFEQVKKRFEQTAIAHALNLSIELSVNEDNFEVIGQPTIAGGRTDEYYGNCNMIGEFGLEEFESMPISCGGLGAYLEDEFEDEEDED